MCFIRFINVFALNRFLIFNIHPSRFRLFINIFLITIKIMKLFIHDFLVFVTIFVRSDL